MILLGELSLWIALLMAIWTAIASYTGGATTREDLIASGERGIHATLALVVLAVVGMWTALLVHDFSLRYVASFTSANLPVAYTVTALWAGQGGALLFWALILAGYSAVAVHTNRDRNRAPMPYVTGTLGAVMAFMLTIVALRLNPFDRLEWVPPDGGGMDPRLQTPGMAIYLPNLYLGYAATAVAFAFAVAALVTRRLTPEWLSTVRRWALLAWFFNTTGILIGMWWAYLQPASAGRWVQHPITNASILPWLVNTAFLHSLAVQEKRGFFGRWYVLLLASALMLSVFATLVTRGGIASGVATFARSPAGTITAAFLIFAVIGTAVLVAKRLPDLETRADHAGMGHASRNSEVMPIPHRRMVGRNRLRYGGYVVYAGVVVLFAALVAQAFRTEHGLTLRTGQSAELRDPYGSNWRFVSEGVSRYDILNRHVSAVALGVYREARRAGLLTSERRQYVDSRGAPTFEPVGRVGILGSRRQDVYTVLVDATGEDTAELRVSFNPLVWWVWFGGAMMALGGLVVAWPRTYVQQPDGITAIQAPDRRDE